MPLKKLNFEVVQGETEHITFSGVKRRNPTVLIRVGGLSMSKKAFILGLALILCQVFDGLLTWIGLSIHGVHMEGNSLLRYYMHQYGAGPVLIIAKVLAAGFATILMLRAHKRRWMRPIILLTVLIYLGLALIPWVFMILRGRT